MRGIASILTQTMHHLDQRVPSLPTAKTHERFTTIFCRNITLKKNTAELSGITSGHFEGLLRNGLLMVK